MSDYELIYISCENDFSKEVIINRYKNIIKNIYKTFFSKYSYLNLDYDEFYVYGIEAIYNSINKYDMDNIASYSTFVYKCIWNNMNTLIKKYKAKKNEILNNSIQIDMEKNFLYYNSYDFTKKIENKEQFTKFINSLKGIEKKVTFLKLKGYKNKEISKYLNINSSQISSALFRVKNKIQLF